MAFNGLCTGNDMRYSSESPKLSESKLKLKAPKSSYEIIPNSQKNFQNIEKVDYKSTKEILFSKDNIPKWIDLSFYIIPKKNGKRIISLHIINKCLISKNPFLIEPNLILYCHENNIDLLRLVPFLIDLSIQMKCDIVSFDYWGFGCSSGKPKINTILSDGEDAINFAISYLKYKIENIILFGKGIGSMSSIYLASRQNYHDCKSLILCMPDIGKKIVDVKVMRSIFCQTLLIMEFENKNEIQDNYIVNLCREMPNGKEWLPIRKQNKGIKNNFLPPNDEYDDTDDVYYRHRSKFIIKLRDYIYPDKEIITRKRGKTSTVGGSTQSESNKNLSIIIHEQENYMSVGNNIGNQNEFNIKFIINEKNKNQIIENDNGNKIKNNRNYDDTEIEINNDEDY
jgi:hypothetical protein